MFEKTKGRGGQRRPSFNSTQGTGLLARFKKWYTDPQSLTPPAGGQNGRTEIVLEGRALVELDGCRGLTVYKEDEIAMRVKEGVLSVRGESLELKLYRGTRIAVMGKIDSLSFLEDEGRKTEREGL